MENGTYELWETYQASGRLSRQVMTGTEKECYEHVDANIEILPYAMGHFVVASTEDIDQMVEQDYPE